MKGLLRKDLYLTWTSCRTLLALSLFFILLSFFSEESFFFLLYSAVMLSMLPVTLQSYDEKNRWSVYCDALPLSRRQVVTEKYLLALGCAALAVLLSLLRGSLYLLRDQPQLFIEMLTLVLCLSLAGPALLLPFNFRFGPEKGRLAYLFLMGLIVAVFMALSLAAPPSANALPATALTPLLGFALGALIFLGSWLLSCRWYEKRELR